MITSTLSRLHPARLLAPVCRRSFYESVIGYDLPVLYRALSGSFPFRHACNQPLQPPGLRVGSHPLRVALRLGMPLYVQHNDFCEVVLYGSGGSATQHICHFRNGRLALLQQVITGAAAIAATMTLLERRYGFRLPAQEEDFLLFNGAGERLVIRLDHTLQLFYLGGADALLPATEMAAAPSDYVPAPQLAWGI
ncbi:hypothetical protein [Flaviaesturariibacter terrae]